MLISRRILALICIRLRYKSPYRACETTDEILFSEMPGIEIGQLNNDVILLKLPESFTLLFSSAN